MANPEWDNYDPYPKMKGELTYLACPYSHKDRAVMIDRWKRVNKVGAKLMVKGEYIFSPISHTHPIADEAELPRGWNYWAGYDTVMISRCTQIKVLMLEGWEDSVGIKAEIDLGHKYGIPVYYIDEDLVDHGACCGKTVVVS